MSPEYCTIKQIIESGKFPFDEGQWKYLMHNRKKNGLDIAIVKVDRIILIKMDAFREWLENHRERK